MIQVPTTVDVYAPGWGGGGGLGQICLTVDPDTGECLSYDYSGVSSGAPASSSSSSSDIAKILAAAGSAAAGASQVIRTVTPPYVVPGTNVLYNPATGQLAGASGVGTTLTSLGENLTPIIGLVVIGGLLLFALKK